ncbi:hypothetical protein XFF6992_190045 [Xanthomonas citri pv. fuscans]|nr:hypothetical protein XAC3608_990060 [Xanthomonas citri pv. citri]SON96725.1 hypothetical protein XFF6990_390035 [Xanthomonas citri pv. fuscans]CEE88343.1 hypothetical protein XACLE20_980034 [Xanthomonas citri pv. citri]CEF24963.1 hypothetical protein XACJK2_850020 [Xanthomonas citri pv. citri]CEH67595.1 hypothetical protein XAC3615_7390007 [Xanthomonas citri pv. citri]
MDVTNRLTGPN